MTDVMNDKEKLDFWNQICMEQGWSKPRELEKWLLHSGIRFSNSGSAVPDMILMVTNKYNLDVIIKSAEGEGLATLILQALSGILVFASVDLERMFWSKTDERLRSEYGTYIPENIIPNYIKKNSDLNQFDLFE
jgi:hypothetical protein